MRWLFGLFHRTPRWNFALSPAGNVFLPDQSDYLQGLALWALAPVILLLLLLVLIGIVWSWRCCCGSGAPSKRYASVRQYSSLLFLVDLVCCVLVGLCLFSNEKFNRSCDLVHEDIRQLGLSCRQAELRADLFNDSLQVNFTRELSLLRRYSVEKLGPELSVTQSSGLSDRFQSIERSVDSVVENISYVNEVIDSCIALENSAQKVARVEYERWSVALVLFCGILIIQFVGLVAFCRQSRSTAIGFSIASLLTFVLNWIVVSFSLALCLGISDFCAQPRPFLQGSVQGNISHSAVDYYMRCRVDPGLRNPLQSFEVAVDTTVASMQTQLKQLETMMGSMPKSNSRLVHNHLVQLHGQLNGALKNFGQLEVLLDCSSINTEYQKAFDGLCTSALVGSSLLLLGSVIGGIFMLVLTMMVSRTWQLYKPRRSGDYVGVELEAEGRHDTTAVSADFYGTHVVNPRTRVDVTSAISSDGEGPLWVRSSPPPAYESLQASRARNSRNAAASRSGRR